MQKRQKNSRFGPWGVFPMDLWDFILKKYLSKEDLKHLLTLNKSFVPLVLNIYRMKSKCRTNHRQFPVLWELAFVDLVPLALCFLSNGCMAMYARKKAKLTWRLLSHVNEAPFQLVLPNRYAVAILDRAGSDVIAEFATHNNGQENVDFIFHEKAVALCQLPQSKLLAIASPHSVVIIDLTGKLISSFFINIQCNNEPFGCEISGIAADSSDRLFVPDHVEDAIKVYSIDGKCLLQIGSHGKKPGQFLQPVAVVINDLNGDIVVSDSVSKSVQLFDRHGQFVRRFFPPSNRTFIPQGLDIDHNGKVYVADCCSRQIYIFDSSDGHLTYRFGRSGLSCAWQVKMRDDGLLFVLDEFVRTLNLNWMIRIF
jgi:hypothetical protein